MLTQKGILRVGHGSKERKGLLRAGYASTGSSIKDLQLKKNSISYHPLTNFETQKYYQNKPKFNGVYSRII